MKNGSPRHVGNAPKRAAANRTGSEKNRPASSLSLCWQVGLALAEVDQSSRCAKSYFVTGFEKQTLH